MGTESQNIYLAPRHYDLLAQMTAPHDLPFYVKQVGKYGGPVLELGCGTGRVSIPLARLGERVTGLDNSGPMIERARDMAALAGVEIELLEADLRSFNLARKFQTILLAYNSINHLLDHESITSGLLAAARHLAAGGRFIIDTFNPSLAFLGKDTSQPMRVIEYMDPDSQSRVVMTETSEYDNASQINRVTWHYEIDGRADAMVHQIAMRIFFPQELDALLRLSEFEIEHKFGDYEENVFDSNSNKQIVVCRARAK